MLISSNFEDRSFLKQTQILFFLTQVLKTKILSFEA